MNIVTSTLTRAAAVALGVLVLASPARADGYLAPFTGGNFGGDAQNRLAGTTQSSSPLHFGVAAGFMGGGIFGLEEDFSFTPNFYGEGGPYEASRVLSLMTNLIVGIPIGGQEGGGVRPYASAGLGLIRVDIDAISGLPDSTQNSLGYNVGGGVMGYFSDHVGVRADLRYMRNLERTEDARFGFDEGHFSFSRGSVGVLFRF